jgi:hypothetical protein
MNAKGAWATMFRRRYLPQLVMTIALPIFNQFDGINSIMFYAPQLFDGIGQGASQALLTHVIIGAVNVATTLVAVFTVDRCVGCGGFVCSLGAGAGGLFGVKVNEQWRLLHRL